jgi:5-methylcytosine-specific restriction enzyme A
MKRNPNWSTDELILALDLYFRAGRKQLDGNHPDVIELSRLLNELPIFALEERGPDFRNPQGVSMKLGNFSALDPNYGGAGLQRGGSLDRKVWDDFSNDHQRLRLTAEAIIKSKTFLTRGEGNVNGAEDALDEPAFPEGRILTTLHRHKERNPKAVEQKKKKILKERGALICEVCDFDFAKVRILMIVDTDSD